MRLCFRRSQAALLTLLGVPLLLCACKPQPTPGPAPVKPTPPSLAAPTLDQALPPSEPATPVAAAEAVSDTAAPSDTTTTAAAPETSVAIYIDAGTASPAEGPQAGKPISITVTPVDGAGRPLRKRDPLLGSELLLVALRYDMTWVQALRAPQMSEPGGLSHRFSLTVPKSGRHLLYFLVKPPGGPISVTPVDLTVRGPAVPGEEWGADESRVAGPKGMSIELRSDPEQFSVCQRSHIATNWAAKGKPVSLLGAAGAAKVLYLAVPQAMGAPMIGAALQVADAQGAAGEASAAADQAQATESVAPIGGDAGTDAWLTLKTEGKHKIVALSQLPADRGGDKAGSISAAVFAVTASGKLPEGGCP